MSFEPFVFGCLLLDISIAIALDDWMISSPQFRSSLSASVQHAHAIPKGLRNLGNSCYMNAVMQSLAACDCMVLAVRTSEHSSWCRLSTDCVLCALERCITDLRRPVPFPRNFSPMSRLIRLLPRLSLDGAEMTSGRQEDAHEFLSHLIHTAEEDNCAQQKLESTDANDHDDRKIHAHNDYLHALFDGSICSRVMCKRCGTVSSTTEAVQGLELEVSHAGTLHSALDGYCRTEELSEKTDNAYDCSVCGMHTTAQKSLSIRNFPKLLRIQFKRFVFSDEGRGGILKLGHLVEFPEHLNLAPYVLDAAAGGEEEAVPKKAAEYRLSAAVVHLGQGLHSGHYTAYLHPSSSNGDPSPWFLASDDLIRRVSVEEVLTQPAYMLFYELVEPRSDVTLLTVASRQFLSPKRVEKRSISVNVVNTSGSSLSDRLARALPAADPVQHILQTGSLSGQAAVGRAELYQQHLDQQTRTSERDSRFGSNPLFMPTTSSAVSSALAPRQTSTVTVSVASMPDSTNAQYHKDVQQRAARAFSARPVAETFHSADASVGAAAAGLPTLPTAAHPQPGKKARGSYMSLHGMGLSRKRLFNSINLFSGSKRRRDMGELGNPLSSPTSPLRHTGSHSQQQAPNKDSGTFFAHQQFEHEYDAEPSTPVAQNLPRQHSDITVDIAEPQESPKRRRLSDTGDLSSGVANTSIPLPTSPSTVQSPSRGVHSTRDSHVSAAAFRDGEKRKMAGSWLTFIPKKIKALFA